MIKIKLINGETYEVEHDQLPEFLDKHQGQVVEYQKKVQPRRRNRKIETTKAK